MAKAQLAGLVLSEPAPARARLPVSRPRPTVVNRGVNGDNDLDKRAQFERNVIAERPDIVLWQLGTNSMLGGAPMETHLPILQDGVASCARRPALTSS